MNRLKNAKQHFSPNFTKTTAKPSPGRPPLQRNRLQTMKTFVKFSSRIKNEIYNSESETLDQNRRDHIQKMRNRKVNKSKVKGTSKKTKNTWKARSKDKHPKSVDTKCRRPTQT